MARFRIIPPQRSFEELVDMVLDGELPESTTNYYFMVNYPTAGQGTKAQEKRGADARAKIRALYVNK